MPSSAGFEVIPDVLADAEPYRATLFDKSPDANWLVVWHQDTALPLERRHEAEGWGPWSTKEGVVYAHAPASALHHIVARGGVLVMRPLLVHASSKSAAPARRRVLHIEYASTMRFEPGLTLQVA